MRQDKSEDWLSRIEHYESRDKSVDSIRLIAFCDQSLLLLVVV